jgi:hypothetical protein
MTIQQPIPIQKIRVTFGLKADGPLPEFAPDSIGQITVGPQGLLNVLETQLGSPSPEASFTTRLIKYLACIDAVDHKDAFYHESYQADPFSVARTLLQWRDQWYLAGWQGTFAEGAPARLADMAAIEQQAATSVEPDLGQRVQKVIALLAGNPVAIESIHLRDQLSDIPFIWQRLIQAINVTITEAPEAAPQGKDGTDLYKLQQHLHQGTGTKLELSGDGSVLALSADSAQDSTPHIALLCQKWLAESPDKTLAMLAEARGDLLDEAMEANGCPRLGFGDSSPWRPVFQVLPLACELLWEPLNPTALFQYLSHPVGPIPARIRERLAQTVASVPGIGRDDWVQALEKSLEKEDEDKKEYHRNNIHYWLESPRFSPQTGVDSATLAQRAQRVADWLMGAREATDDVSLKSLYFIALNQALEFVQAIERLKNHGRDTLNRDNVLRLIEDVRGTGAPVADRQAEVCSGQARALRAQHAGAFYSPADIVIWWDCQATDRVHRWPWSRTERTALAVNGVILQSEDQQLQWLGKTWLRPILVAKQQCTFILHNDAERHHPVWDQIASLTQGLAILNLADSADTEVLGIPQTALEPRPLPPKTRWWQLPKSVELPKRDAESYSSLDAYTYSPYQWLLRYAARIRPGSLASVSDGSLLKGNLAHRLYQEFLNTHPDIAAIKRAQIPDWVDEHLPVLLQREGALLLTPGRQSECEYFISQIQESLTALIEHLQQANVVSVQMELWQEGQFTGGKLNGSIDVLATRADGQEAILDIKWGSRSYRRDSLRKSSYLQLATYAQLRRGSAAALPKLSYFIVKTADILSLDHDFFPAAERIVPDNTENWVELWQRFEHTWHWRKTQFDQGLVEVTVTGTEPTDNSQPGEMGLTLPDASDNFNDYKVITGWDTNA